MKDREIIRVAVIGATGSVGGAVLDICGRFKDKFKVVALAARSNEKKLTELAEKHEVKTLCLTEPDGMFKRRGFNCLSGTDALSDITAGDGVDHVVFASSGTAAIKALADSLSADKDVSLANKESIVVAGPWTMPLVKRPDQLRPVDSEHSAVWQCIRDEKRGDIEKIWLTASGGPFRKYTAEQMEKVRPADALNHPVWAMGPKITVDSATLMNKGIECIEAMQLFSLGPERVGALIHPGSRAHGMVQFLDGTFKMLLSHADMRLPAAAALAWPERLDLTNLSPETAEFADPSNWKLEFSEPDIKRFPCFGLALRAGEAGGPYPALLIGADEAAVRAFLSGEIGFTEIAPVIEETMERSPAKSPASLEEAIDLVSEGQKTARGVIAKRRRRF